VSDNPYQSPAEMPTVDMLGKAEQRRLGGFVVTVLILDSIPCLLRLFVYLCGLVFGRIRFHNGSTVANVCLVAGTIAFALSGNVLILLKKRAGVLLAAMGLVLSLIGGGLSFWRAFPMLPPQGTTEAMWRTIQVSVLFFWALWLIIYGIVVWKAAKRLKWFRADGGTKRQVV
jgi:hypothetical protein